MKKGGKAKANFPTFDSEEYNKLIKDCCKWAHSVKVVDTNGRLMFRAGI